MKFKKITSLMLSVMMIMSVFVSAVSVSAQTTYKFGSSNIELSAGKYKTAVHLKNSSNLSTDSMAKDCMSEAVITVDGSGKANISIDLSPVAFAGLTAYATDWKIYQSADLKGEKIDADHTENAEGKTTNITFDYPNNSWDGVYVNMYIDVMDYAPDAYILFDWANITDMDGKPVGGGTVTPTTAPTTEPTDEPTNDFKFGSSETVLKPGKYSVPVTLKKSDGGAADTSQFIKDNKITVTVDNSSIAKVSINIAKVDFWGYWYYQDFKIYQDQAATGDKVAATETKGTDGYTEKAEFVLPNNTYDKVYFDTTCVWDFDDKITTQPTTTFYIEIDWANAEKETISFGTSNTKLETGTYLIPASLKNASNLNNDSMAAECIKRARVTVSEDGKAKISVDLQPVMQLSQVDWAYDWKIYQSADQSGEKVAATERKNEQNNVYNIEFDMPNNAWDGVYATMFINAMGYAPTAYIKLDWANAVKCASLFGSETQAYPKGDYRVIVSMMKADNIQTPSMAGGAFVPYSGKLTVDENGVAKVTVNTQAVQMGPFKGYAKDWKVYNGNQASGETTNAVEKDNDGDEKVDEVTFTVPDNSKDGFYVNMFIDAMNTTQNAYIKVDYSSVIPADEQYKAYHSGHSTVQQFGKYDVYVIATTTDGRITDFTYRTANMKDEFSDINLPKVKKAMGVGTDRKPDGTGLFGQYMKDGGVFETDSDSMQNIDVVSGATYSSYAVRDAVMNAFGFEAKEEEITLPTNPLEKGEYEVDVAFYSDVVRHSLVETEKAKAKITVDDAGKMKMSVDIKNGTTTEPLYALDFNGYYPNNDKTQTLTKENATSKKEVSDFSDTYFAEGTEVVTNVEFPLEGAFAKIYNTNFKLYVPAMNNLNDTQEGIVFEHGKFDVDCFAKVYWDSIKEITPVEPTPTEKTSSVPVRMMNINGKVLSMGNKALAGNAEVTEKNDGTVEIVIPLKSVDLYNLHGHLTNMWTYTDSTSSDKTEVTYVDYTEDTGLDGEKGQFVSKIKIVRPKKEEKINIRIRVDAMDNNDQDATLVFDYDNANKECAVNTSVANGENNTKIHTVELKNCTESDKTGEVLYALYNEGALVGIKSVQKELKVNEIVNCEFEFDADTEYDSAKVFVWNDTRKITPLFADSVFVTEE